MTEPWLYRANQEALDAVVALHRAAKDMADGEAPWNIALEQLRHAKRAIAVAEVELAAARTEAARLIRADREAAAAGQGTLTGDETFHDSGDPL